MELGKKQVFLRPRQFIAGISDVVVGKKLDELEVDRVAGSSLTSDGFDQAVVKIKDEAATAAE